MFKDYYQILGIPFGSDSTTIKVAYREQSLKWHPDKHPEMNVTHKMQDINEAYAILKDSETKQRYDNEYLLFAKHHKQAGNQPSDSNTSDSANPNYSTNNNGNNPQSYYNYTVNDETLNEDIFRARAYAKTLVEEFLTGLKENSKLALKGAWDNSVGYLAGFIVLFFISVFLRACIH